MELENMSDRSNLRYCIYLNEHLGTYLKFWLKGALLKGRRALNQEGCLLFSCTSSTAVAA